MTDRERYRVVLVDDVPEIREIIGFLLEDTEWFDVVGHAASGREAIDVIEREQPDVALIDIELPGALNGWDVIGELAPRLPATRFVVLSGSISEVAAPSSDRRALAAAVVEKGASGGELAARLMDVLGRRETDAFVRPNRLPVPPHLASDDVGDAWLAAIVNSSPDAVIGKKLDGTIISWNYAAERLYGYSADEAIGSNIAMLVPDDRPAELPSIFASIGAGRVVQDFETSRITKDGTRIDVVLTISPVVAPGGTVVGAATVARDVSRRRYVESTLARAVAQLERKNRELLRSNDELDSFAAVASHDLAQPLQVAFGFVDMVRSVYGARLDDEGREWLDHASRGLERMRSLVRDILEYSRTGSGEPSRGRVDLDQVLADVVADLGAAIDERAAEITLDPLPTVVGDESQYRLVFQNLLANAVKFVPAGQTPRVTVRSAVLGDDVVVDVVDNGVGIPPEARQHVFEMFRRVADEGFEGSGVGLAIVKKIVGRHGGSVWVEAGDGGRGTRMRVQLPLDRGTGA